MKSNNRITYRFDRAGNTISDSSKINEAKAEQTIKAPNEKVVPLYPVYDQHNVNEQSPWNSPFQDDIGALEKLIRESEAEAGKREWPTSDENTENIKREWPLTSGHPNRKKQGRSAAPAGHRMSSRQEPVTRLDSIPAASETLLMNPADDELDPLEQPERRHFLYDDESNPLPDTQLKEKEWPSHNSFTDGDERSFEIDELYTEDAVHHYRQRHAAKYRHSQGPSWLNVFLSVAAALATGALFGYFLLSLFTGASLWPSDKGADKGAIPATGSISQSGDVPSTVDPKPTASNGQASPPEAGQAVPLTGLDQTYYMLQFGVFSTVEGRDTALAQLNAKGLAAAALASTSDYRVYAGMSSDKSDAEIIRAQMADLDLYIKEVAVQTPDKITFNGAAEEIQSFFDQTRELVRAMDELTLTQLEQTSLSPIGTAAAQAWQTSFGEWSKKADTLRIGIADEQGKAYAAKLIQAVQDAAAALQAYNKKPSKSQLWSVQSSLMESILIQKEWFDSISTL